MEKRCTLVPAPRALRYSTYQLLALLLLALSVDLAVSDHLVTGTPPSFTGEPEDAVVFGTNADMSRASLTLYCNASGDPSPTITWYRNGARLTTNQRVTVNANGTLRIVNITEGMDATRAGRSYHCTAMNKFGTIRSRTAIISYAYFDGFVDDSSTTETIAVTTGVRGAVAIECRVRDANPPPNIVWVYENGTILTEDRRNNQLRFLDNGRYLVIRQLTTEQVNANYQCQVTNAELHRTVRNNIVYDLVPTLGANETLIYKGLINRTIISGTTIEYSYIASAGPDVMPFSLLSLCQRSGSTLSTPLEIPLGGGIVGETIPDMGRNEVLPSVASSVTFEVTCSLLAGGPIISSRATISVQAAPGATLSPNDNFEKLVMQSHTFTCSVSGIPAPTVTWYRNNMELSAGGVISISRPSLGTSVLRISSLAVSHTGMYQCMASNVVGRAQASRALQVRIPAISAVSASSSQGRTPDRDIRLPLLVAPTVGGKVTLFVVIAADPCPTIQWRRNGISISNGGNYMINNPCSSAAPGTASYNFTLAITANSASRGTYNATLTNTAGTQNVPSVFVTQPVPVVISELQIPNANCLKSGNRVNIQCVNSGFPRPDIVFFKGTERITPGTGNFERFTVVSFDTLRLSGVQEADGGDYVCDARIGDRVLNRSQPVNLVFCTDPEVESLPQPTTHTEGDRFELICTFTGIPNPEIRWEKDNSVFLLGEGRRIINSTGGTTKTSQLEITTLLRSDAGLYTCSVTNVANRVMRNRMDSRSVRLEVRAAPPPPVLDTPAIIGIAAGGAGAALLLTVVCLLMLCVYRCAKRGSHEIVTFEPGKEGVNFTDARGNVDRDSDEEMQPEAYAPDYESLPALRPAQPPQYRPTPNYPHGVQMADDMEMTKVPLPDTDSAHFNEFISTPYGKQDNGNVPHRPTVDDFLSEDAQFV